MEVITKKEARAEGLKRFYTGKPCKHGHIAEQYTANGKCVECERERGRKRRKDPDYRRKENETNRKWKRERYASDPDFRRKKNEASREYARQNPEAKAAAKALRRATRLRAIPLRAFKGKSQEARQRNRAILHGRVERGSKAVRDLVTTEYWEGLKRKEELCALASEFAGERMHLDHITPLNAGGEHHPDNLMVLPASLNLSKNASLPEEFAERVPRYAKWLHQLPVFAKASIHHECGLVSHYKEGRFVGVTFEAGAPSQPLTGATS